MMGDEQRIKFDFSCVESKARQCFNRYVCNPEQSIRFSTNNKQVKKHGSVLDVEYFVFQLSQLAFNTAGIIASYLSPAGNPRFDTEPAAVKWKDLIWI